MRHTLFLLAIISTGLFSPLDAQLVARGNCYWRVLLGDSVISQHQYEYTALNSLRILEATSPATSALSMRHDCTLEYRRGGSSGSPFPEIVVDTQYIEVPVEVEVVRWDTQYVEVEVVIPPPPDAIEFSGLHPVIEMHEGDTVLLCYFSKRYDGQAFIDPGFYPDGEVPAECAEHIGTWLEQYDATPLEPGVPVSTVAAIALVLGGVGWTLGRRR